MATLQLLPLTPETTDQVISIELTGNPYKIRVLWNERFGYFSLSLATTDDIPILTNIKMVKNYPLVQRYKRDLLPYGEIIFIQEKGVSYRPGYSDLATNFNLYYYEPDIQPTAQVVTVRSSSIIGTIWDSGQSIWDDGQTTWDQ